MRRAGLSPAPLARRGVTLYGLPLVAQRRVGYARIDPVLAREMFIRHALVEGDWQTRHHFLRDNARLREEYRAAVFQFDRCGNQQPERRRDQQADARHDDIKRALAHHVSCRKRRLGRAGRLRQPSGTALRRRRPAFVDRM